MKSKVVAAAYITGILPIKKDGTESAISDFEEYTILNPGPFSEFTGFTEDEVDLLCRKNDIDASKMKEWYDGYTFEGIKSVYNPYSVMQALKMRRYESYWQKTSAAESLFTYISMDYDGLQDDIARLITGERLEVDINTFKNDVENFSNKDDVLTLLIHLGYLLYRDDYKTVTIPNEEIRQEFVGLLKSNEKTKLAELVKKSESLLNKTLEGDGKAVALAINSIRESQYAPTFYNNEQAFRYIIKFAYIVCVDQYLCIEELPSGKEIADVAFIPKKKTNLPAMIVELKWNKTEEAAIAQIRDKNYPKVFSDYAGEVIMVGINYNERTKEHSCVIEKLQK